MPTLEIKRSRPLDLVPGLSVPVLTALDASGKLDEDSQLRLVRWVAQGAEIVFSGGTTGEWNRISPPQLRHLNSLCLSACQDLAGPVLWAGITSKSLADTLENLEAAHAIGAPAVVLAPLSIDDAPPPLELFRKHIIPLFERLGSALPLCLYDNADIAVKTGDQHIRTRDLKELSRLDFVFGIKVSASASVIGNYLKGARHFKTAHEFGVYLGNANLSFSIFPHTQGWLKRLWIRLNLGSELPLGVVSGPANLFPKEWRRAWQACVAGELDLIKGYAQCFEDLGKAWRFASGSSKSLACMKLALAYEGILASPTCAEGTPSLNQSEAAQWLKRYGEIKKRLEEISPKGWTSVKPS
jgi:dihydrodipicolinate synthase/N-acetylneuraminate lyase